MSNGDTGSDRARFELLEGRRLLSATLTGIAGPIMQDGPPELGEGPQVIVPGVNGSVLGTYAGDGSGTYAGKSYGIGTFKLDITSFSNGVLKGKVYATVPGEGTYHFSFDSSVTFTASGGFSVHMNNGGFDGKLKGDFADGGARATGTITGTLNNAPLSVAYAFSKRS
jgi:hypothetical protein